MSNASDTVNAAQGQFYKVGGLDYQAIGASTTAVLGAKGGAAGDYLDSVVVVVTTLATSFCSMKDGSGSLINLVPNGVSQTGTYRVELHCLSRAGAWSITTGAGCTAVATGLFT